MVVSLDEATGKEFVEIPTVSGNVLRFELLEGSPLHTLFKSQNAFELGYYGLVKVNADK